MGLELICSWLEFNNSMALLRVDHLAHSFIWLNLHPDLSILNIYTKARAISNILFFYFIYLIR